MQAQEDARERLIMEKDVAIEEMQTLKTEISAMEVQIKTLEEALTQIEVKVFCQEHMYLCPVCLTTRRSKLFCIINAGDCDGQRI